jgi:hypothetical protein
VGSVPARDMAPAVTGQAGGSTVPEKQIILRKVARHSTPVSSREGSDPDRRPPVTVETLLAELIVEVKGLRADLARDRDRPCQSDDARFMVTMAASVQGHVFSIRELRAHALVDPDLQRAIGALTNQQLGKRLRDLAGRDVGGLVVTRVTRDEHGVVWAVSAAPDLHDDARAGDDHGA